MEQMSFAMAILLGFVQGVAEFLPISSSGHLALLQNFFGLEECDTLFNVLLHLGTLVAVIVAYWRDVVAMIREFCLGIRDIVLRRRLTEIPMARRLVLLVIIGTIPCVLVLPVKEWVSGLYNNTVFVSCALLVTGLLLFLSDRMPRGTKTERSATILDVVLIGLAQVVATVPGISRSGATISVAMARGFRREFAVRYSFLLSLPAVVGANVFSIGDAVAAGGGGRMPVYLVGMVVAAVAGYACIRLLKLIAERGRFGGFSYYCWAVGIVALIAALVTR